MTACSCSMVGLGMVSVHISPLSSSDSMTEDLTTTQFSTIARTCLSSPAQLRSSSSFCIRIKVGMVMGRKNSTSGSDNNAVHLLFPAFFREVILPRVMPSSGTTVMKRLALPDCKSPLVVPAGTDSIVTMPSSMLSSRLPMGAICPASVLHVRYKP